MCPTEGPIQGGAVMQVHPSFIPVQLIKLAFFLQFCYLSAASGNIALFHSPEDCV